MPQQAITPHDIMQISRDDFNAMAAELTRLRLIERAVRNLTQADSAVRELLKISD